MTGGPFAEVHNSHGESRHLHIQICKHIYKDRNNEKQHYCNYADNCKDQNDRVDGCFTDSGFQFGFFFKVDCHTCKGSIQTAGGLTSLHHMYHDIREDILLCCHGICQGIPFFYIGQYVCHSLFQIFVFSLFSQHLKGFLHWHTCLGNTDELSAEYA